jgi:hypothetical protein
MEEAKVELERGRNMENSEVRSQNEQEEDLMNDAEEFEDEEEEEESRHERQVR